MFDPWSALTAGLPLVLQPSVLGLTVAGALLGIIVGALPGLSGTMAVAIMVTLTYPLSPPEAFALLLPTYAAAAFGGSIGAILLNIPGTGAAVMTTFDGYPMSRRGEAGKAIGIACIASFVGGIVSAVFLAALAPVVALWALRFGAHEYFAVAIFGLGIIAYISPSIAKGLLAAILGLLIGTVGADPQTAMPRFTYGQASLIGGLQFIPVMIGLFGISEILLAVQSGVTDRAVTRQKLSGLIPSRKLLARLAPVIGRSTLVGLFIGVLPAAGPTIASIVSYGIEKRAGRNRAEMGQGAPEGVAASETANNAATGSSLVPMIALGIPGDAVTAILIGALMIHGLRPGPSLFLGSGDIVSSIFILFIIGNILFLFFGLLGARFIVRALHVPPRVLFPSLLALCIFGSYAVQNNPFDILVLFLFGIVGYAMRILTIPIAPMILGFILGPLVEDNLRRSLMLSDGRISDFFTRPLSGTLIVVTLLIVISPYLSKLVFNRTLKLQE